MAAVCAHSSCVLCAVCVSVPPVCSCTGDWWATRRGCGQRCSVAGWSCYSTSCALLSTTATPSEGGGRGREGVEEEGRWRGREVALECDKHCMYVDNEKHLCLICLLSHSRELIMQFLKWLALKIPLVHLVIGEQWTQLHLHKLLHYKVQYTSFKFCQETREHFVKQCSMFMLFCRPCHHVHTSVAGHILLLLDHVTLCIEE